MKYDFDSVIAREKTDSIKWDKYAGQNVVPLWVADMDFAVAPEIIEAMQQRMQHPVFGYTHPSEELINALQAHLQSVYDWQIEAEWIHWIPGVVAGLAAGVRAYATPGTDIVVNPPIYHHFFQVHNAEQNQLIKVPLRRAGTRWTYDIDAMKGAITENTSMIMLCSPHNPTGTVFSTEELAEVCAIAKKAGAIVLSDEIHCGLVLNESTPHVPTVVACPEYADSIVTLMSASKTFNLAGLNCSYAIISSESLRQRYAAACAEVVPFVGTLAYTATEAAFTQCEPWRQQLLQYLRENLAYLQTEFETIPGMQLQSLDATYLAWIDATELGLNDTCGFFERHGLGFSSGEQFGQAQFLRLNFACSRTTLEKAVGRIRVAVASSPAT